MLPTIQGSLKETKLNPARAPLLRFAEFFMRMKSVHGLMQGSTCWQARPRGRCLQGRYPAAPAALQPRMRLVLSSKGRSWAPSASSSSGEGLGMEEEEDQEETSDPREQFRVSPERKSKDLDTLMQQIERGDINLAPRYQRQYVWPFSKAARLMESVFAGSFIPPVVLHTGPDGVHDVVDGKQRLITLYSFWKGQFPNGREFKLNDLELLTELNGKTWDTLPPFPSKRHFLDYTLTVTTFPETTSLNAVLRVYADLNCGSESLNKQQVRRAVYSGPYIDLLGELASTESFRKLLRAKGPDASEQDQELILRFLALWRGFDSRSRMKQTKGRMDEFLDKELRQYRHLDKEKKVELKTRFEDTVCLAFSVYGEAAFRRWNGRTYGTISPGIYDSVKLTMADIASRQDPELKRIETVRDMLRKDHKELCLNSTFASLLKFFSWPGLVERQKLFQDRVMDIVVIPNRKFPNPEELMQQLLVSQNHKCALCCLPITLEVAELDHITPYSKGGSSDPSNAQLLHRWSNRSKAEAMMGP